MRGFILAGIRRRVGRSLALLAGMLLASTGFTVLTGATTTSRLQVEGVVESAGRPAYDLLIRPRGARSAEEDAGRVVRANALSGLYGGLTEDDLRMVAGTPGVEVAAPIAMMGYANADFRTEFDLTSVVDRGRDRQVIRVDPTYLAERGLSSARGLPSYLYVTTHPLLFPDLKPPGPPQDMTYGGLHAPKNSCGGDFAAALEAQPDGSYTAVCRYLRNSFEAGATDLSEAHLTTLRLLPDGRFQSRATSIEERALIALGWSMPLLLAAIDPVAEDRLVGLRGAVTSGAYPSPGDGAKVDRGAMILPTLAAERPPVEGAMRIDYSRVDLDALPVAGTGPELDDLLGRAPHHPLGHDEHDAATAYQRAGTGPVAELENMIRTGPVQYSTGPGGVLRPVGAPADLSVYQDSNVRGSMVSWQVGDVSFRPTRLLTHPDKNVHPEVVAVGTYDASRLTRFDDLTRVPLETYEQTPAVGADKRSVDLLGGKALSPGGNPAGYLLSPPAFLTTLTAAKQYLGGSTDLISAIRVRVEGVDHYSKVNAERVRLVAERIAAAGLDVDITFGASLMPQTVELPAGAFGRPTLALNESWVRKGVSSSVEQAADRKSLVLFVLVLVVCALFVANAVTAAVRSRTAELAILACLGWPGRRIGAAILGEVAALGLAAGLASLALAKPAGAALGVQTSWSRALLAVPVALGLSLLAGLVPAWRAARTPPADLLQPLRTSRPRGRRPRTVLGLGLAGLVQVPGRTLLAVGALTVGVAALTTLAAVTFAFHGTIVGTALGDAVSFTARRVDVMAVLVTVALSALAVADVLYLNIRDRAAELATLRATGWPDAALIRLVVAEGGGIGLLGGITGAGIGLLAAGLLAGGVSGPLAATAIAAAAAGILVAMLAALAPALLIRRLPTAALLTEE
ncbi:FtsX-like permease family protein [Dactylosporangium sp. NPDC051484]|uniref:FtsX-like permease family protein n=1 Tax=Dactylosporangium sp. NPDC051484 TaxID=3154942 RepID=UPI00344F222F